LIKIFPFSIILSLCASIYSFDTLVEFESNCFICTFFVELGPLVFYGIDISSSHFSETDSLLKLLNKVQTALRNQEHKLPTLSLRQLEWVGEVKQEYVPRVSNDIYELQPRS
jgi:hypothetical protein